MRYLVQFQINIFALAILSVLYLIMKTRSKVNSYGKTLFNLIMITTAVAIITEPLTWIFDGELFFGAFFLEYFTNIGLFLIGPIIGGLTMSYVDYSVYKNPKRVQDRLYYLHLSSLSLYVRVYNIFHPT